MQHIKPNGARARTRGTLRIAATAVIVALASIAPAAHAQSNAVKELAAPPPIQLPLKPNAEYAKFPRYAGMLGARQIVLRLGPKTDDPSGVHGEYQFTDTGEVILIAGDREDTTLEVEESNDGTHITGNWVGKFAADGTLSGERMNVDDSNPQEFDLRPLAAGAPVPPPGAPATQGNAQSATSTSASTPAGATTPSGAAGGGQAGGQPVNGVSNLRTGE
ncbi:hypothetical protein [Paraburkholderia humisilvae]|uniref:Uncharacterized protein n=1 Tax=Paraburkholderia humisilvae TaxID=627669 RepID=A0A6J5DBX2_9BURK|nr:hypothetical protein [Paraburkholderia humisilvae]CAB3750445.1 hypothetical protein LMG29542_01237 [Paraburkholderia humisilvae]